MPRVEENVMKRTNEIKQAYSDISNHLEQGILPFWLKNGIDPECGGYLTCFDAEGKPFGNMDKLITTQTRMIWGMSALYGESGDPELLSAAKQGIRFFIDHFWDISHGGWFWRVSREGNPLDTGKVVYGQSFAIYALAQYTLSTGDPTGLEYAEKTFDLLQKFCADTRYGGYFENLEPDWQLSPPGFEAGDRKSLDIHMHLMEAFTVLAQCSGKEIHRRKLREVMDLIVARMTSKESGCGFNQFKSDFTPIPAINIRRTWNAERATGQIIETPLDTTSYGHNVELSWLLNRASSVLNVPFSQLHTVMRRLVDHALEYGLDREWGGIYRDGPHRGSALVTDKEWWQQAEVLVGFLDAYEVFGEDKYLDAFFNVWSFAGMHMINWAQGEWRQLLGRRGEQLCGDLGNDWKAVYHTGRSMMECRRRLAFFVHVTTMSTGSMGTVFVQ